MDIPSRAKNIENMRRKRPWPAGQEATALRLITKCCPDQLKLPFALWTRQAVCQLLAGQLSLRVSVRTVGRHLRQWGLTPQKPVRRAYERDPSAVQRWLREEYTAIHANAKQEKAEIHWGDERGLCFDYNMISTITGRGTLRFMVFQNRFTETVLLAFLRRLLRSVNGKVFLIVDSHPVHHGKMAQRWLAAQQDRIALFYLPRTSRTKPGRFVESGHQVAYWPPAS